MNTTNPSSILSGERWRASARALGISLAVIIAQTAASLPIAIVFFLFSVVVTRADPRDVSQHLEDSLLWLNAITALVTCLASIFLIALALRWLDRRGTFKDLGWVGSKSAATRSLIGAGAASILIVALVIAMSALGSMRVTDGLWLREDWSDMLSDFAGGLVLLISMVLTEELVFRGYVRYTLTNALGARGAIIASAILFALFRIFVGGVTRLSTGELILAGLTAWVAGLVLGELILQSHSLWTPLAAHFAWSFIGGFVFSMPVAGTPLDGLLGTELNNGVITGGRFGPDGGLAGLIGLGIVGLVLWLTRRK